MFALLISWKMLVFAGACEAFIRAANCINTQSMKCCEHAVPVQHNTIIYRCNMLMAFLFPSHVSAFSDFFCWLDHHVAPQNCKFSLILISLSFRDSHSFPSASSHKFRFGFFIVFLLLLFFGRLMSSSGGAREKGDRNVYCTVSYRYLAYIMYTWIWLWLRLT